MTNVTYVDPLGSTPSQRRTVLNRSAAYEVGTALGRRMDTRRSSARPSLRMPGGGLFGSRAD